MRYASMGEILLVGDFYAHTHMRQTSIYDWSDAIYKEINTEDVGLHRFAQDLGDVTEYGTHFLKLGVAHGLIIFNGLSDWLGSDALTC